ncbi:IS1 family transposase, partial [Escherichia coli]|uniref:IS1 family transposase n=1 Tax=Escherichia coli TaxID=562 RepID=UPI003BC6CBD5
STIRFAYDGDEEIAMKCEDESRLKGKLHVISKRYTQRIERHNLNLWQHLARLGRKSLSFSKSVELHDKVIGHYLNIKHYQ